MIEETQDVTQETTDASSAENQTEETSEMQTDQSESSEESKVSKTVPYDRFAEVISTNKQLKEEITKIRESLETTQAPIEKVDPGVQQQEQLIREQLKKMGFVSKEEIAQIESDRKLEGTINSLAEKYNGKDGRPKFNKVEILEFARDKGILDLEAAYKVKNHDLLMDHAIKQAQTNTRPVKSESSDGSGASEAGTTNGDLISAVKKGDKNSLLSFIKRQF